MKQSITLTITSLLSILLMTLHLSEDVVRGFEPGGFKNVVGNVNSSGVFFWVWTPIALGVLAVFPSFVRRADSGAFAGWESPRPGNDAAGGVARMLLQIHIGAGALAM